MKYFSPSILDGSVTTAKLADLAVTTAKLAAAAVVQAKLDTATDTASGTIAANNEVTVSVGNFTFFPEIEVEKNNTLRGEINVPPGGVSTVGKFAIRDTSGTANDYVVFWRSVVA